MREEPAPSPPGPWLARCCGRSACTRPPPAATSAARHTGRRTPALRELGTRRRRRTRPLLRDERARTPELSGRAPEVLGGDRARGWQLLWDTERGHSRATRLAARPDGFAPQTSVGLVLQPQAAARRTRRKASERRGAGHRMQGRLRGGRARPRKVAGCGRSEGRGFGAAAGSLCPSFDRYRHDATCRPSRSSHRQRPRLRVEVR